jgi:DNA-binding transcriptional LysR family regulator
MILSPRAESLRTPVADILRNVGQLFREPDFDPTTSDRRFRLMMPDFMAELLLPPLLSQLAETAPNVRLEIAEWRGERTLTREYLETVDCVVSGWSGRFFEWRRTPLLKDCDVLAIRRSARAATHRTLEAVLALAHVAVVGPGELEDPVDTWLRGLGRNRNIVLKVPTYLLALRTIATTSLVGVLPALSVGRFGAALKVVARKLPLDPGTDEMSLHYAESSERDAAGIWFRKQILDSAKKSERLTEPDPNRR